MPRYSDERREAVVAKLLPPRNLPVREVAQQEGISEATVYKWRKEAREQGRCLPNAGDGGTAAECLDELQRMRQIWRPRVLHVALGSH